MCARWVWVCGLSPSSDEDISLASSMPIIYAHSSIRCSIPFAPSPNMLLPHNIRYWVVTENGPEQMFLCVFCVYPANATHTWYIYIYMDGNGANSVQWFTSKKMVRPLPLVIWDQSECVVRVRVCVCVSTRYLPLSPLTSRSTHFRHLIMIWSGLATLGITQSTIHALHWKWRYSTSFGFTNAFTLLELINTYTILVY